MVTARTARRGWSDPLTAREGPPSQPSDERLLRADRLLIVGLVSQAGQIYAGVLETNPRSLQALVGLANCEVELGNLRAAYGLALRVLELDRSSNVALRMEARLSEILATRGERIQRPSWITR